MFLFILVYLIYFIYRSMEAMHMLQQNFYNENNRYIKWVNHNLKKVFCIFDFIPLILLGLTFIIEEENILDIVCIISMFIYVYCIYLEYRRSKNNQNKLPLKATSRIKRLFITLFILYVVPIVSFFYVDVNIQTMIIAVLVFLLANIYYMVAVANIIDLPMNSIVYYHYYRKAKNKLKAYNKLEVVGITGSYGKTSCKNILNDILASKYVTRPTPKNYNTPYGLMLTINNHLDKFDDLLIAEMGAYTNGRIKNLCDFVNPKYGILTIIGEAHLETFKTKENIQKTKFELIESLPSDGVAILNMDDPYQVSYELKNKVKVVWVSESNPKADVYASDIKVNGKGTSFVCHYKGGELKLNTKLLGNHNILNILLAVALAKEMKVEDEDIQGSVSTLKATEHRLELKKIGNFYMLDDAYNSNPVGASSALDLLSKMNGTKVIVTPGMIELGNMETEENYKFGEQISKVCDYVILIGKNKTKPIYEALIKNNYNEDNIFILNNVHEAYPIVDALKEEKKDLYALFENDLPDIYTEGDNK